MSSPVIEPLTRPSQPIRKTVRRLRWFKQSFAEQVDLISQETGVTFEISDQRLAAAFVDWLRAFEAQKPSDPRSRRPYVGFAAGLMLCTLIAHDPLAVERLPETIDKENPAHFWPQGYVYVAYCLNVRSAILEQDFAEDRVLSPVLSDIETWWSFKENVREDNTLSIAFLDLFSGDEPNWAAPGLFQVGDLRALAPSFYQIPGGDERES